MPLHVLITNIRNNMLLIQASQQAQQQMAGMSKEELEKAMDSLK